MKKMKKTTCSRSISSSALDGKTQRGYSFFIYDPRDASKKFFLMFIAILLFVGFSFAQTTESNPASGKNDIGYKLSRKTSEEKMNIKLVKDISSSTLNSFKSDFPGAENVVWMTTPTGYTEVEFTLGNSNRTAFYDSDNHLIGNSQSVDYNSIPANASAYIAKHYKGYTPEKVMFYDDNEANGNNLNIFGNTLDHDGYYASMKNGNKQIVLHISTDGNVTYFCNFK